MSDHLTNYLTARQKLLDAFKCKDDYPVRVLPEYNWEVGKREGVFFLTYYADPADKLSSVVVKSGSSPLVYKYAAYTMVIAIDCVKFAFVFKNAMKING